MEYIEAFLSYKKRLAALLGIKASRINGIYQELLQDPFYRYMEDRLRELGSSYHGSMIIPFRAPVLYVAVRALKPNKVVETGVAYGFSSAFILRALELNQCGHLYSIDLPNQRGEELQTGRPTGWLITQDLKKRWTLILGDAREKLPPLLKDLGKVDIFYHDSLHTYENMRFEFNAAWEYLPRAGLLLADDVTENKAFADFLRQKACRGERIFKLGIIKKE
jgi:predicted O-methyltransferase YrrM